MGMFSLFKSVIMVQLFYALGITLLTYSLSSAGIPLNYIGSFSDLADSIDLKGVSEDVQNSLESQTSIPVIELGALVFYSGNILLDLILNFAFAIPEMIGLIINGIGLLFNIDSYMFAIVEIFAGVVVMVMYFVGLMGLLQDIRSGRVIT